MKSRGIEFSGLRFVASETVPKNHVISQKESRYGQLQLTYSSGGPAVQVSEVPAPAAELLRQNLAEGELILVVETSAGTAYKSDALLVGPCAAVDLAYRTFLDPAYHDECY